MSILEVKKLKKSFGNKVIFNNLSLKLDQNKIYFLTGPSGEGKTILLKCLVKLLPADSGHIYYSNKDVNQISILDFRRDVLYCPQYSNNENISIEEFLLLPFTFKIRKHERYPQLLQQEYFDYFKISKSWAKRNLNDLSGGEFQLIQLIRHLLLTPKIFLLDEPFSAMDQNLKIKAMKFLSQYIRNNNLSLLTITHDQILIQRFSDRTFFFSNAKLDPIEGNHHAYSNFI